MTERRHKHKKPRLTPEVPRATQQNRAQHVQHRRGLPIWAQRANIVEAIKQHAAVILVAETGSGKSTQVPQFLLKAGICQKRTTHGEICVNGAKEDERGQGGEQPAKPHRACIACTQPRRVAAITVAERVAQEVGSTLVAAVRVRVMLPYAGDDVEMTGSDEVKITQMEHHTLQGHTVGYAVRFDDRTSPKTAIKYMTDGVLLREAMGDALLSRYSVIILDEAHERSLQTDILMGLIRRIMRRRADLRVVVMSATLEVEAFTKFFQGAAVVRVEGRQFPVDVYYCEEPQDDYIDAAYVTAMQIHESEPPGDVLIFLSGQEEIEALSQLLQEATLPQEALRMEICPLFAALPPEQQLRAFQPAPQGTRKLLLATNIAETSVTINNVRYVVDTGIVKVRRYVASTGLESLKVTEVAKSQANQRAGRAGREAPGCCYRLYMEDTFETLAVAAEPEIQRVNLAQVVLQLLMIGVEQPQEFDYLSPPSPKAITQALQTLLALGCLQESSELRLADHGRRVAMLPLSPVFAHMVLLAARPNLSCTSEALTAVAMLSAENVLFMPPQGQAEQRDRAIAAHKALAAYEGDVPTLIQVYDRWVKAGKDGRKAWCARSFVNGRSMDRAHEIRVQLAEVLRRLGEDPTVSCGPDKTSFMSCLSAGLFLNVAQRQPPSEGKRGCYKIISTGREVVIHPSSVLHGRNPPPQWVNFTEVVTTTRDYIRGVTMADPGALRELVPRFFKTSG